MPMGRKYLSGAKKRKAAVKKQQNLEKHKINLKQWITKDNEKQPGKIPAEDVPSTSKIEEDVPVTSKIEENVPSRSKIEEDVADELLSDDPAKWPKPITDTLRIKIVRRGPKQIKKCKFPKTGNRSFSNEYYSKTLKNFEKQPRSWLLYSESKNSVYCFCCLLFDSSKLTSKFLNGYNNWQKLSLVINEHEKSKYHIESYIKWQDLIQRLNLDQTIDKSIQLLIKDEQQHLRQVFCRIIDVILFLSKRNLAFRGSSETIFTPGNGNFLGLIELLEKYYVTLSKHIKNIQDSNKRVVHYFSHQSQNLFLKMLSYEVQKNIIKSIKKAKYYSIQMDCTPDLSHTEQTSIIIRYVKIDENENKIETKESFIGFLEANETIGEALSNLLLNTLKSFDIDIMDRRGQSYDNGANMKGQYKGVQARIRQINENVPYVPCLAHNFNLLLCDAAASTIQSKTFFGIVQRIYTLFSDSTKRWAILTKHVK